MYLWRCPECQNQTDTIQKMSEVDVNPPFCNSGHAPVQMERQITAVNFSFKGGPPTRKFHDR
jgi:putative FmdB family regulatory protein